MGFSQDLIAQKHFEDGWLKCTAQVHRQDVHQDRKWSVYQNITHDGIKLKHIQLSWMSRKPFFPALKFNK